MSELSGALPIDKPAGPTSHDVVAQARRALRLRRIGHTGTLDPFASGLLLLCLGPSTRLAEYLTALPKSYRAVLRLGEVTDTDDLTGEVVHRSEQWRTAGEAEVRAALEGQRGEREQLPPVYSAKRVGGERAYRAARAGREVQRTAVPVTIHRLEVLRVELPEVEFEVRCSSGTYIRSIARDAGEALGAGAHLTRLRRTGIGDFSAEQALSPEQMGDATAVEAALLPPSRAVGHLPRVLADADAARALAHGRAIPAPPETPGGRPLAVVSQSGDLLAIGESQNGRVQPRKVFT